MTVVNQAIPSLTGGISQQPDPLRLLNQCTLLENGHTSVVKGLKKRPPLRHIAKLMSTTGNETSYTHTINRSSTERYEVIIGNGTIQVFSLLDGSPRTVTFPSGTSYLSCGTARPKDSFQALTVQDYTFILNKTMAAQQATSVTPTRVPDALVYVRAGNYDMTYTVTVNGKTATYSTASSTAGSETTVLIAGRLIASLVTLLGTGWTLVQVGSVIYIQNNAGTDFTISTTDGQGDQAMYAIKGSEQLFSSLPPQAVDGFTVKITGEAQGSYTGYYVQYASQGGTQGGVWLECPAPGSHTGFVPTSLPWELIRNGDGTFTFQPVTWVNRTVGDDAGTPMPSFIGFPINFIFFNRNRLGFLSGENVIMSKAGQYFQFWPDTATQVLDSDPIDESVNDVRVSTLYSVATYQNSLILFSDQEQFVMTASGVLSPRTVEMLPATAFENLSNVVPISTGRVVYFAIPRGSFAGVREFTTLPVNNQLDADEITAQVPQYIPQGVYRLAAASNDDTLAVLTDGDPSAVYVYKWFYNGTEKMQSAWSRWVYAPTDKVMDVAFINMDAYITTQRPDGVYLDVIHLDLGYQDGGPFTFQINLDRLALLNGTFNAGTNTTTWTLPYAETNPMQVVLGQSWTNPNIAGAVLTTLQPTSTTITAIGNWTKGTVYAGRKYTFRFRFSRQFPKEYVKGAGFMTVASNQEGRLQLNHMQVTYELSSYFRAEVTPYARPMNTYAYTGNILGDAATIIGAPSLDSGVFRFPVLTNAATAQIDLVNDTYMPSTLQSAEWEGRWYTRSQRL
jgi:hypothetical protein